MKFKWGDKVKYGNRYAIFIRDISEEYDFNSKMALILTSGDELKRVRMYALKKGEQK